MRESSSRQLSRSAGKSVLDLHLAHRGPISICIVQYNTCSSILLGLLEFRPRANHKIPQAARAPIRGFWGGGAFLSRASRPHAPSLLVVPTFFIAQVANESHPVRVTAVRSPGGGVWSLEDTRQTATGGGVNFRGVASLMRLAFWVVSRALPPRLAGSTRLRLDCGPRKIMSFFLLFALYSPNGTDRQY